MLRYASSCVGKPFSGTAMARSLVWPRQTDGSSFFCAELVAAVLKEGGLLDSVSNPGAATPESLHALYKARATTTANPFLLRQANCQRNLAPGRNVFASRAVWEQGRRQRRQEVAVALLQPLVADEARSVVEEARRELVDVGLQAVVQDFASL